MKQVFHSVSGKRRTNVVPSRFYRHRSSMKDAGNQVGQPVLFHPAACSIDSTLFPLVFPFVHLPFPFLLLARNATAIFVTARDLISAINPMELNFPAAVDRGIIKSPRIVSCFAGHKRLFHAIVSLIRASAIDTTFVRLRFVLSTLHA